MNTIRSHSIELILLGVLLLAIGYFAYLAYGLMPASRTDQPFSGSRSLENARRLVNYGPRPVGSPANKKAGDWIIQYVTSQGWDVVVQPFTITNQIPAQNIIAIRSPATADAPVGLVVTHYDTRLVADNDPNPANRANPGVGANKGASGVALLTELARTLDIEAGGLTICLAFFDAEENGGLPGWEPNIGSKLFLENLDRSAVRCAAPRFAIVVDLVGASQVQIHPVGDDTPIGQAIRKVAGELGFAETFSTDLRQVQSNNTNWFLQQGTESATIADTTYPFIDSLSDTLDKLDVESLDKVGQTLEVWLERGGDFTK
ncbi:MAG: M28 family peptidase [Caldilineaceae bacterium]